MDPARRHLTLVGGAHTAKFGVTYSNVRYFGNFRNFRDGPYSFTTDRPFDLSDPSTHPLQFVIVDGGTTWDERANVLGMFGQDSWRVMPLVTLNYGIRYDTDDSLSISGAKRVHTVSPRLGIAWSLDRQARTVLRASAGSCHDSEHTNLANVFILNNLLLERAVILSWSPAFKGLFNPFYDPQDPDGSAARLRQFLADAFAQGRTPDFRAIPTRSLAKNVNGIDEDFTVPVNRQLVLGVSRELTHGMAISADFLYSKAKSLLVWRDENLSPKGTPIDPTFGSKTFAGSLAQGSYRAAALRYDLRVLNGYAGLSYTWSKCEDNTSSTLSGNTATNPFNLDLDAGPCDTDVRHALVVRGGARLPLGFEVSSILTAAAPRRIRPRPARPCPSSRTTNHATGGAEMISSPGNARIGRSTRVTSRVSVRLDPEQQGGKPACSV